MDDTPILPYLHLTTIGWKSGNPHQVELWFTTLGGRFYVISEQGQRAHWVQNLRHNPEVAVRLGHEVFSARTRLVETDREPTLHARVCEHSKRKYDWGEGLVVEITPDRTRPLMPEGMPSSSVNGPGPS